MREIHAKNVSIIDLGRQGENLATQVIYDLSDWIAEYGDGTAELIHKRVGDLQPYPVAAVRDGNTLIWTVTSTDTAVATKPPSGYGKCELRWYVGDVLAKSKTWKTLVSQAMDTPSETAPPDHDQGWVDQVLAAGASAKEAADKAFSALSNAPYIGDNGNWYLGGTDTGKPSRGEAGPALAVTNTAAVGQTVKITAVDENGQPTQWEAADLAGVESGYLSKYRTITDITVSETVSNVHIEQDDNGNGFSLSAVRILIIPKWVTGAGESYNGASSYRFAFNYYGGNMWNYGLVYDSYGVSSGSQLCVDVKLVGGYLVGYYSKNNANMGSVAHSTGGYTEIHDIKLVANSHYLGSGSRIIITGVDA